MYERISNQMYFVPWVATVVSRKLQIAKYNFLYSSVNRLPIIIIMLISYFFLAIAKPKINTMQKSKIQM